MSDKKRNLRTMKDEEESDEEESKNFLQELQDLIRPRLSTEPISLTILAAHAEKRKTPRFARSTYDETTTTQLEQARQQELQLFEKYIGPHEDILAGAFRHVQNEYADYNSDDHVHSDRYNDPEITPSLGPRPDMHVWMGLFLGKEEEKRSREEYERDSEDCTGPFYSNVYAAFQKAGSGSVCKMPILEVACNILRYLADKAETTDTKHLLYFCAVYGLSHSAGYVLDGKYGAVVPSSLTIDTPLPIPQKKIFADNPCLSLHLPFVLVVAILDYHHAVRFAVESLQADIHAFPARSDLDIDGKTNVMDYRGDVGTLALYWAIQKNQPQMVKTLTTKEIGVQFRWLTNDRLKRVFNLVFHMCCDGDERGPVWLPPRKRGHNEDDYYYDRTEMRRRRAKRCYQEKHTMLLAVIEAGIPKDLFVPSNVDFEATITNANKLATSEGLEEASDEIWKQINSKFTEKEQETIALFNDACVEFNGVTERDKWLDVFEFAHQLYGWFLANDEKATSNVQKASLEEYDEFDPRWKQRVKLGTENFVHWWEEDTDC